MRQPVKLAAILAIGVLAMSSASILIRWALADGAPPLVIAAYRLTTASIALTAPAIRQQAWKDYTRLGVRLIAMLTLSGALLCLHFATWVTSLAHTSVVSSVVLVTTTPLWIGLAAPIVLRERTSRLTWVGILLAIAGGTVIGLAEGGGTSSSAGWGNLLALLGAIFGAGYLMIGRGVRERLPLISYLWWVYGTAAVLLVGLSLLKGLPLTGYLPATVAYMVALGLLPQLVGHSAANYALRQLSASFVAVVILGEPIGSTLLAILLLGEWPQPLQVVGGALTLMGIVLASLAENHRRGHPAQATR